MVVLATSLLATPAAYAGVDGETTYSSRLEASATFRHYGDYLYVTDLADDDRCAIGHIAVRETVPYWPNSYRTDDRVVNCDGPGTTVRKSFSHIREGTIIRFYACASPEPVSYYNYYLSCGPQIWAQA